MQPFALWPVIRYFSVFSFFGPFSGDKYRKYPVNHVGHCHVKDTKL
jgi:hypothetical protein